MVRSIGRLKVAPLNVVLFFLLGLCLGFPAFAGGKYERSFGVGGTLYTGKQTTALAPDYGLEMEYSSNSLVGKTLSVVNRFKFGMMLGSNFAGKLGAYIGVSGIYASGLRVNLAKDTILPFIELGPMIGIFGIRLGSGGDTVSTNQSALKYGYMISSGFDKVYTGKRGSGSGWGMGVTYFSFFRSPSMFEFPAGGMSATGVSFEIRWYAPPLGN